MTSRRWFGVGALVAGVGVALGAFGAHVLRSRVDPALVGTFETGVRYQVYHGLALMAVCLAAERWSIAWRPVVWLFAVGTALFAGSLYALVLTGARGLGVVTPFGGVCLLLGWGVLGWSVFRSAVSAD